MRPPRGRLFQDETFEVVELAGCAVEQVLGFTADPSADDKPQIVLLKARGQHWQRFFLDAGLGFWEEWDEAEAMGDYRDVEGLREVDYGVRFGLARTTIHRIRCSPANSARATNIAVELESGILRLSFARASDIESDSVLTFEPACRRRS